jgi:isocitrate dehydrogenase
LDVDHKYYDLWIEYREHTDDQVTADAAHAITKYGSSAPCATITPDQARVAEFSLKRFSLTGIWHLLSVLDLRARFPSSAFRMR